jgi:hypothetical protein
MPLPSSARLIGKAQSVQRIASREKLRWIESMGLSNKEMKKDSE